MESPALVATVLWGKGVLGVCRRLFASDWETSRSLASKLLQEKAKADSHDASPPVSAICV